jgi:hypothetical protein
MEEVYTSETLNYYNETNRRYIPEGSLIFSSELVVLDDDTFIHVLKEVYIERGGITPHILKLDIRRQKNIQ